MINAGFSFVSKYKLVKDIFRKKQEINNLGLKLILEKPVIKDVKIIVKKSKTTILNILLKNMYLESLLLDTRKNK